MVGDSQGSPLRRTVLDIERLYTFRRNSLLLRNNVKSKGDWSHQFEGETLSTVYLKLHPPCASELL